MLVPSVACEISTLLLQVINGTVTGGKNARGLNTVISYRMFESPEKINEETLRQARTLGWCAEIVSP